MTAQFREILIYEGRRTSMASQPLDPYLGKNKIYFHSGNTACWRGYQGKWRVRDNKLYLIELTANLDYETKVGVDYLFPGKEEVFAEWYTGEIRIQTGDMLRYVHMGYASVYETDIFLKFEKGVLISKRLVDNRESED